jgi:two-component system NarL family sensor kinase
VGVRFARRGRISGGYRGSRIRVAVAEGRFTPDLDDDRVLPGRLCVSDLPARAAVGDIRRLVYELRPPALDELGLVGALERQAEAFASLDVRVEATAPVGGLPAAVEVAAYRIAVEAMTNVARHSRAQHCRVCVELNGGLELEVSDDGQGVPEQFRANVGLDSMRERAAELGGTCTIERGPAGGTRVRAQIPMPEE